MTCIDHATPIAGCVGCLGRWDRAMAEQVFAAMYGIYRATARMALAEIDRLTEAADRMVTIADEAFGLGPVEPLDETLSRIERGIFDQHKRIAELEQLNDRLTFCERIGEFHDGEVDPEHAERFRAHLPTCAGCQAKLHDLMQNTALVSPLFERRQAVLDAAVAWVRAGGTLAALTAAVNGMEDGNG